MGLSGSSSARRRIRTTDPADQGHLECACVALEQALDGGNTAAQLDVEQIDYLTCDLVAIRHRGLVGAEPNDAYRTVVTKLGDESIVVESYFRGRVWQRVRPVRGVMTGGRSSK